MAIRRRRKSTKSKSGGKRVGMVARKAKGGKPKPARGSSRRSRYTKR